MVYFCKRIFAVAFGLLLLTSCLGGVHVLAQSPSAIAQGAPTQATDIVPGALLSAANNSGYNAELADITSSKQLLGIAGSKPLLALSGNGQTVQIVISGTTPTLVSDINGLVQPGDKIAPSPIAGVGMLATTDTQVVGTARTAFNLKTAKTQDIIDHAGKAHTVHIGEVVVQVSVAFYVAPTSKFLPPFVQNAANALAGRQVSITRILFAFIILLIATIGISILIYTATRSSIASIGRNPLAAKAIRRGLLEVGAAAIVLLVGSMIAAYLVLTT